jgi:hypothetical protein
MFSIEKEKKMKNGCIKTLIILSIILKNMVISQGVDFLKEKEKYSVNPFTDIGKNSLECFTDKNYLYHISGILGTGLIISTGVDKEVHNYFVRNNGIDKYTIPGVYGGYVMPVALCGGLLAYGYLENSSREKSAASAAIQACLISLIYSSTLKFFTGRPNPEPVEYTDNNSPGKFRFGLNRGGVHYGWPSGHMITNTALVTSLLYFYKDNATLNIIGSLYLGYLFVSVISHEKSTMHWFSDAVAGTLMGYAIGKTAGKNFREKYYNHNNKGNWMINSTSNGFKLSFVCTF